MRIFPSIPGEPELSSVFRRFPHTLAPLLDYHDRMLRDPSPLTAAERELIAAYVSGLNACHGAHRVAAGAFGVDEALFDSLMVDPDTSAVDSRLKPILSYVRKRTLTPAKMIEERTRRRCMMRAGTNRRCSTRSACARCSIS
jgi:AhpD family alkylhydroperoxidase